MGHDATAGLAADPDEQLTQGWEPTVPSSDSLLLAATRNHEGQVRTLGATHPYTLLDEPGVVAACSGLPDPFANLAVLTAPVDVPTGRAGLEALEGFAADRPEAPILVFCPWGTPDLRSRGHAAVGFPPLMLRPAGDDGAPSPQGPPVPDGVAITEVTDADALARWERALIDHYPTPGLADAPVGHVIGPGLLGGTGWRFWLAVDLDGTALGTSATFVGDGVQVLNFVAVADAARGRGLGAALVWPATVAEPGLPAMLVASDLGRPVYERLGYRTLVRFPLWIVTG
jgi:GNAT superfamily N-acetyltransferase